MITQIVSTDSGEPVALEDAKDHLRIPQDFEDDDTYITGLITVARVMAEKYCNRHIVRKTLTVYLDYFPGYHLFYGAAAPWPPLNRVPVGRADWRAIELVDGPCLSVDSIKYLAAADDVLTTLDASVYAVDLASQHARICLKPGQQWPQTAILPNAVQIAVKMGVPGNTSDITAAVDAPIRQAVYLLLGHLYENRAPLSLGVAANALPWSVEALLEPYRLYHLSGHSACG